MLFSGVLIAALVACGHAPSEDHASYGGILEEILTEADEVGIDNDARAVLVAAMEANRPISLEEVKQAQYATIECVRAVGFDVQVFNHSDAPGGIAYIFGIPGRTGDLPEEMAAQAYACEERSVWWIDAAYQRTHIEGVEELESRFEPFRDALVACLIDRGAPASGDMTMQEILELDGEPLYYEGHDLPCVAVVGFDTAP
jgi:hypothetical protein